MTWVKLSDTFAEDPRWDACGPEAFTLHVAALCYCMRNLTDGHIPARAARRLPIVDDTETVISLLVDSGFWRITEDGYEIVGFTEDQRSAEDVERDRKLKKDRQAKWRAARTGREPGVDQAMNQARPVDASRNASTSEPRKKSQVKPVDASPNPSPVPSTNASRNRSRNGVSNARPEPVQPSPARNEVEGSWAGAARSADAARSTPARRGEEPTTGVVTRTCCETRGPQTPKCARCPLAIHQLATRSSMERKA